MKKKIIYGLLLAVAMVTASSSFVSCKDYEGDDYAKLTEDNAYLQDYLNAQILAMQTAITNCGTNCATARSILEGRIATLENAGYATQAWVNGQGYLTQHQDLSSYATQTWVASQGYLTEHQDLSAYATQAWVTDQIGLNGQSITEYVTSQLATYTTGTLSETLSSYLKADTLSNYIQKGDLEGYLKADTLSEYAKKSELLDLYNKYVLLGDSVKKAYTWASYAYQRLAAIDSIATQQALNDSISSLRQEVLDSIHAASQEAYNNFLTAKQIADSARIVADSALVAGLAALDSAAANKVRIDAIEKAYQEADKALQAQIDTLKERVTANEENIQKIIEAVNKEITGIEIQGAYNNIFGYFALPVGIQSNVLAAYWGQFDAPVVFPIGDNESAMWVGGIAKATSSELPTPKNGKFEAGAGLAFDESEGNAGTLYVTVNPSNVNFDGKTVELRTSNNMQSVVKLGTLTPSETILKWGLTRANSANGFYEAKATISKEDVLSSSLKFDLASVKTAVQEIMNNWRNPSNIDKTALANAVYKNMQQNVPRLGVQAMWQDEITGQEKAYVSKYDLAAFTAKPFGYDFLYGSDFSPYVTKVQNKVTGKVHAIESEFKALLAFDLGLSGLPTNINLQINPSSTTLTASVTTSEKLPKSTLFTTIQNWVDNLKNIKPELNTTDPDKQPVLVYEYSDGTTSRSELSAGHTYYDVTRMSVDISDVVLIYDIQQMTFGDDDFIQPGTQIATATIDISSFINDMNNSISQSSAGLNDMLTAVAGLQGKIDSKLAQISNIISSYASQVLKVTDKVFGFAAKLLKNPNRFIQPVMFATADAEKVVKLSTEELLPTQAVAGSQIALFPTSLTGELLAPAFKKYIAVTNVTGGSGVTAEEINSAIEGFNTVLNGNEYNQSKPMLITTQSSWSGATVEILYEALGYNGKVAGRKYYITFK